MEIGRDVGDVGVELVLTTTREEGVIGIRRMSTAPRMPPDRTARTMM